MIDPALVTNFSIRDNIHAAHMGSTFRENVILTATLHNLQYGLFAYIFVIMIIVDDLSK